MYSRRNRETKQRFTIKKFKVGAASVLIGTLFVGFAGQVKAEEVVPVNPTTESELLTPTDAPEEASTEVGDSVSPEVAVQPITEDSVKEEVPATNAEETVDNTELSVEKETVAPSAKPEVRRFIPTNTLPKDPTNNATEKIGEGELLSAGVGFRANVEATEGPTNANKVGYGNNPVDGVFEDGSSFEAEDMTGAQEKSHTVNTQIDASGPNGQQLGPITYNWKEKETTTADGWTVKDPSKKVKIVEVLAPTNYNQDRDPSKVRPSKTYNEKLRETSRDVPRNNNASGFNEKQVPGAIEGSKYLELVNQGTTIQKEYEVNPNSQIVFSVTHTGAYGGYNSPGDAEKIKLRVYDAVTDRPILTIRDAVGGEEAEVHAGPVADPLEDGKYANFTGTNTTGWKRTGRIYDIPSNVNRIRVEIEAGEPGDMLPAGNDGYLIDSISMVTLPGVEIKTDVKSGSTGAFGEENPYKKDQEGTFLVTINNVGALNVYQAHGFTTTVHVPEGVELPESLQDPAAGWHWLGKTPANHVKFNKETRQLTFTILPGAIKPGENGSRTVAIPFRTADDYKGEATLTANTTFHIDEKNINNVAVLPRNGWLGRYGNLVFKDNQASADPNYVYKKTIYVDSIVPAAPKVDPIHTDGITGEDTATGQSRTITVTPPILDAESNDLASMEITFPGNKKVTLTQKADGWYNGETKIGDFNSPLTVPVPVDVVLDEGKNEITATVTDKAGNVSEPAEGDVVNEAPEVFVGNPYTLRAPSTEPITDDQLLEIGKVTATDLEDDRDGVESTTPSKTVVDRGNFDPNVPGKYTITVKSVDSEGKESSTKTFEIEVVDPAKLTETITRTINYKYEDGTDVPNQPSVKQTVTYTRTINENGTGFTDWASDKKTFDRQNSPEVAGYTPDDAFVPESAEVTPTAEDITVDVTYKKDTQRATVTFVNKKTNDIIDIITETGKTGEAFTKANDVETKLAELEKKGYAVENPATDNNYPEGDARKFDTDKDVDQEYTIQLVEKIVPVPTTPPVPGQPVNPEDPNSPVWPPTVADLLTAKDVTRTVTYVKDENGSETASGIADVNDKVTFERSASVNLVTGEITYGDWVAKNNDTTFDKVDTPVLEGYIADKASVPVVDNVTAATSDITDKVVYKPIAKYVPKVPEGYEKPTLPPYENDPNDPTGVVPPKTAIPHIPGTTPVGPEGPLAPVDPKDPTKGYVPPSPTAGDVDTPIVYVEKGDQLAIVNYVVEDTGKILATETVTGKTGKDIVVDTTTTIADLEKRGYELVKDGYTDSSEESKKFDDDNNVSQTFTVTVRPKTITINPEDPKTPGTPIDPTNPEGPKWPDGVQETALKRTIKREVMYVKTVDGQEIPVATSNRDEVTFTRTATVNAVTGEVTYSPWMPTNDDTTFDAVASPVVQGYLADKAQVPAVTGLTVDSYQATDYILKEKVVYTPIGSFVPKDPEGNPIGDPIPYPNDPKDPTKPGTPTTPIPYIPGTTPQGPDGQPLTPVDPKDPSKGYNPPAIDPNNPGKDTDITYVKDTQKATITFVDPKGEAIPGTTPIEETGKSGEPISTVELDKQLAELKKKGYVVKENPLKDGANFDTDKAKDQDFTVVLEAPKVDIPVGPQDPNKPVGPDNPIVPLNPDGKPIKPGDPINPNNPDGPKWTDEKLNEIKKNTVDTVTRTIDYVKADGTKASDSVVQNATFSRPFTIDGVTLEVTYGAWTPATADLDAVKTPVVTGYLADKKEVAKTTVAPGAEDITETVTYRPIGNFVPKDPEGNPIGDPIPYPNDPKDPTKPGTPTTPIPHIPGTTPVGPDGQPLKPVDPNDPTKGYIPPVMDPNNPGKDIDIVYIPKTIVPGKELHPEVPERSGDSNEGDTPNNAKDNHSGNPSEVSSEQAKMGSDSTTAKMGSESTTAKMTELPKTGDAGSIATAAFGLGTILASLGLVKPRRKKD